MPKPTDRTQHQPDDFTHRMKAIDLFTDREGAIAAFERLAARTQQEVKKGEVLPVLHFYGVGGSGKSLLLEKLTRTAASMEPPLPCALVDFHHETQRGMIPGLLKLKAGLERNHHISFPSLT